MKLTIESMMYGPDGLAHAEDGKAVFVAGGVAGDVVEAQIVEDGASFSRATVSEVLNDMRQQKRCLVKYEVKQGCFHITVN